MINTTLTSDPGGEARLKVMRLSAVSMTRAGLEPATYGLKELRNRARRRAGVVSERLRAEVIARDGYVCQHCGRVVRDRDRRYQTIAPDNIEIDHVVPLAEGATTTIENLVVSCMGCNKKKGGRSLTPLEETA
jgi:hypothetical protein